jgi:2-keto-4-pentenoate hydratase/2-oxohepta-3-ene-1,7-dioic acid hydratase in catechol pathway
MKFVCYREFDDPTEPVFPGLLYKGRTLPLARVLAVADAVHPRGLAAPDDLNQLIQELGSYREVWKELEKAKLLDQIWQEVGVVPAAPLPRPNRIFGIARSYAGYPATPENEVFDDPIVFTKASTAVIADGQTIVLPREIGRVVFEGELVVVIGKHGKHVPETEAMSLVAGYTIGNDITASDMQKRLIARGLPWFLSKSQDTFAPLGPCLVTADEIPDPHKLQITTTVNDEVKQDAPVSHLLFSIPRIISYLSSQMALEPGDVIYTGSPPTPGPIKSGDIVEVRIPEIGSLRNSVLDEEDL